MEKSTIAIGLSAFVLIAVALAVFVQSAPTTVKVGQATFGNYIITLNPIDGITNQAWLGITNLNGQYVHYISSPAGITATPAVIFLGETKTLNLIDGGALTVKVVNLELFPGLSFVKEATLEVSVPGQATAPSAPQNLAAQAGNGQVTLTWQASSDNGGSAITNYKIYRGATSANKVLIATIGNVLTFTDAGLPNSQQVFYEITAVNPAGESSKSNEATATPASVSATTKTEFTIQPGSIIILPGNDRLQLTSGIAGGVQVLVTDANGSQLANQFINQGQTIDLLSRGYTITAKSFSIFSTAVFEIAASPTLPAPALIQLPSAPQNIAAQAASGQVTLSWQAPANTGGATIVNYRVYRGTTSANKVLITTVAGNVLTFQDTGLANGQKVFYKVTAVNQAGEGSLFNSVEVSATPAAGAQANTPPSATMTVPAGIQRGSITLSYKLFDNQNDLASIIVEFSLDNGVTFRTATRGTAGDGVTGLATSFTGTDHTFVWNSVADNIALSALNNQVMIRIRPSDAISGQGAGPTVTFSVDNRNQPPTVSIFNPAAGAVFTAPAAFTLEATAADDGTVAKVEFFQGATKLGEDTTTPFTQAVANLQAGSYSFTAVATDNSGSATTSSAVGITVVTTPTAPSLFNLLAPATGSTIQTLIPTLSWADSTGETVYTVEVSTVNTFATIVHSNTALAAGSASYNIPAGALAPSTTYFWRVTARNTIGNTLAANGPFTFITSAAATANSAPVVTVATPSGTQSGNIVITYQLIDLESNASSVAVQFSIDGGATFATATSSGGDGIANLASSPAGTAHTFIWNSVADGVAASAVNNQVRIRITPSDAIAGTAVSTNNFAINNVGLPSGSTTTGPSGGGGGGGGGGEGGSSGGGASGPSIISSSVLPSTLTSLGNRSFSFVVPAESAAASVIQKINMTVIKDIAQADASVQIIVLDRLPSVDEKNSIITALPNFAIQPVVKVIQIIPSAILSGSITQATIEFDVIPEELAGFNLAPEDTVLARFSGGEWTELPTGYLGRDNSTGRHKFKSVTPGFSVFAVTRRTNAASILVEPTPTLTSSPTPSPSPSPTPTPEAGSPFSGLLIAGEGAVAVLGIIAILVIALLYTATKNKGPKKPEAGEQESESPQPDMPDKKAPKRDDSPQPKAKAGKGVKRALDDGKDIGKLSSDVQSGLSELQKEVDSLRSSMGQ